MANIEKTTVDVGSVIIANGTFSDELLTMGGAATVLEGTILARDTSTQKLVLFVKGGSTNGNGVPVAVAPYELVADKAGDFPIRAAGGGVRVDLARLVIAADGDNSNIDGNVLDDLRVAGIYPEATTDLSVLDN